MKKTVLTFGLIAGAVLVAEMLAITLPFHDQLGFGNLGLIVGYTTMLVAFLLIFFGVRSYRDNVAGGTVGFGRAFSVGILIGLVASACYVAAWEVYYFGVGTDFMAKYQVAELEKARASGKSADEIAKQKVEMDKWAKLYENPAVNAAVTLTEPLPVALIMSLVSAGVLSRRRKSSSERAAELSRPGAPAAL